MPRAAEIRSASMALRQRRGASILRAALSSGGWSLAGTLVGRLANVGALLWAAAVLGSEGFGGVSLALATVGVVTSVSSLGLPVAAQKLVAEARQTDPPHRDRLIDASLGITLSAGVLTMSGFLLTSGWTAGGLLDRVTLAPIVAAAAPLALTTPCVEILVGLLAALERFKQVGMVRAVHGCTSGIMLVGVLLLTPGALPALWAVATAEVITCLFGWRQLTSALGPRRPTRTARIASLRSAAAALLRMSLPAMLAGVSLQPALWLGQVLLSRQPDGLTLVGGFAVALRWHAVAIFVPATMGSVLLPMLGRLRAAGRQADARSLFVCYGGMTLTFSTLACLLLVVLASPLMGLQGPEYLVAAPVLAILAVALVPSALNNVLSQRALAEGQITLWVWSDLALAATLTVSAAALIPTLRAEGLAWAYVLGYTITCVVLLPVALTVRRRVSRR